MALSTTHADALSRLDRRPKLFVAGSTFAIFLLVLAFAIADLWSIRTSAVTHAEKRAGNLALVLSEYMREVFSVGDASLRQLAVYSSQVGGPQASDEDWTPILSSARAALSGIGSLSVTDADGKILHSSQPRIVGESRRNEYVFQRLSALTSDQLIVGRPFLTISTPHILIIPFGRRLVDRDGTFVGTIVATAIPEDSRALVKTVDVGTAGMVWVFHPTGVVLFREPSADNPIGESAGDNLLFKAVGAGADSGTLRGPVEAGGAPFLSAFQRIGTPPLIVGVSLNRDEVLDDWYHERTVTSAGLGVLGLTLGMTVLVLFRQIDARARVERELSAVQQREAATLREANDRLAVALASEQRARQDAEAASYVKDEFLMTVSHELRTPLTAIYGWSRLLGNEQIRGEQRTRALATIERNARVQTRLIDDLLDVSRVITGKLRLDIRQVNLGDLVRGAIEGVRPALAAKAITLDTAIDPAAGLVAADPERLQQIVWNLLSNATKFTPTGGQVQLRVERSGSDVLIVVTDSGVGIAPDFLPYVFDRFRQQEGGSRRHYGGLGLGLAIVRHLVELHGGTVRAESRGEGQGATFRVTLPIHARHVAGDPADLPLAEAPRRATRLDGVRVLVVDDEAEARELFASILEHAGATVSTAASATDALGILEDDAPDVLMSDIEMPGQDGYQLAAQALARAHARGLRLNAIAVTAYARSEDRARAFEHGFQWHLSKPVEPSELVAVVASLIHARASDSKPN